MNSKTNITIFLILLMTSILGAYYKHVNSVRNNQSECEILNGKCTFTHENGEIQIVFLTPIETEEEILLNIDLPDGLTVGKAWIEGINMFMGKTPVILENAQYVTFLGSCNLTEMQWRLNLEMLNKNGQVLKYSATFYTSLE